MSAEVRQEEIGVRQPLEQLSGISTQSQEVIHAYNGITPGVYEKDGLYSIGFRSNKDVQNVALRILDPKDPTQILEEHVLLDCGSTDDKGKIFSDYVTTLKPGSLYDFSINGSKSGVMDPYARKVTFVDKKGFVKNKVLQRALKDSYSVVPPSDHYTFKNERPHISDPVVYEAHVMDLTLHNPDLPSELRGTYKGLAKVGPELLKRHGFNCIQIQPPQAYDRNEEFALLNGLEQHWGYNTTGYFAPQPNLAATDDEISEWMEMVDAFWEAGIAVGIDLVTTHTAGASNVGELHSPLGLDSNFYRRNEYGQLVDRSGCGNTIDFSNPAARRFALNNMRYWSKIMGVSFFRHDLASIMIRDEHDRTNPDHPIIHELAADPILSTIKHTAEPWDASLDGSGHAVELFKRLESGYWDELDGCDRDAVRDFLTGRGSIDNMSAVLAAYGKPYRVRTFITTHDGFTMRDLFTYDWKHNDDNGEGNRDGHDDNHSWNCGVEGDNNVSPRIKNLRRRVIKNGLLFLAMAEGTPMVLSGDEVGKTKKGNNNSWCQRDLSAYPYGKEADELTSAFTARVFNARHDSGFFGEFATQDRNDFGWPQGERRTTWYNVWGKPMEDKEWHNGSEIAQREFSDTQAARDSLLYVMNGMKMTEYITLPKGKWEIVADTMSCRVIPNGVIAPTTFAMLGLSSVLLRRVDK